MDDNGDFVIAWQSSDVGYNSYGYSYTSEADVYAQRFSHTGRRQGGEFFVNTTTEGLQYDPSVAMDADGDFVVTWTSWSGWYANLSEVRARRFTADARPADDEFLIAQGGSSAVALDDDGDCVVAFVGWYSTVRVRRYNAAGVSQGGELVVDAWVSGWSPDIAMDDDGDFVVGWEAGWYGWYGYYGGMGGGGGGGGGGASICGVTGGGGYGSYFNAIKARRYNAAGVPQGAEITATSTTSTVSSAAVAMDADGDFVVAWDGGRYSATPGVFAQRYTVGPVVPRLGPSALQPTIDVLGLNDQEGMPALLR
jgi:hypothetical protein